MGAKVYREMHLYLQVSSDVHCIAYVAHYHFVWFLISPNTIRYPHYGLIAQLLLYPQSICNQKLWHPEIS